MQIHNYSLERSNNYSLYILFCSRSLAWVDFLDILRFEGPLSEIKHKVDNSLLLALYIIHLVEPVEIWNASRLQWLLGLPNPGSLVEGSWGEQCFGKGEASDGHNATLPSNHFLQGNISLEMSCNSKRPPYLRGKFPIISVGPLTTESNHWSPLAPNCCT